MADEPAPAAGPNHQDPRVRNESTSQIAIEEYHTRIGIEPDSVTRTDRDTLARLQRAHVTSVPFENLAIVGDPTDMGSDDGIVLSVPQLHEKILERERGGYCFELNGLYHSFLAALGYKIDRIPARIVGDDGAGPPANHHTNIVTLDQRYIVDVGMGTPAMRRPTPLSGEAVTDEVGVTWRVVVTVPTRRSVRSILLQLNRTGQPGMCSVTTRVNSCIFARRTTIFRPPQSRHLPVTQS